MPPKASPCPVCGQPASTDARPFCGSRCRDRDLLQWLGEGYRIPGHPVDPTQEKSGDYGVDSSDP
jgi:endogenous inhibitor of DNA gyrase (YacG/DUF329 family)